MRLAYILLVACVVLAATQAAAVVLGLAILLGAVVALFEAPRETAAFLVTMAALGAFAAAPLPALAIVSLGFAGKLCATHLRCRRYTARRRSTEQLKRLPPPPPGA